MKVNVKLKLNIYWKYPIFTNMLTNEYYDIFCEIGLNKFFEN